MDRDRGSTAVQGVESRKGRLMGKLFGGRERKVSNEQRDTASNGDDINSFLHGPSAPVAAPAAGPAAAPTLSSPRSSTTQRPSFDTFQVAHAAPPQLAKLDTRAISRYPNAVPVSAASLSPPASQPFSKFPKKPLRPGARGLHVQFTQAYPEIIGEGGDESEMPVVEVARRRREMRAAQAQQPQRPAQPQQPTYGKPLRSPIPPHLQQGAGQQLPYRQPSAPGQYNPQFRQQRPARTTDDTDDFVPTPIRRTQTGFSSVPDGHASATATKSPRLPFSFRSEPKRQASPERPVVIERAPPPPQPQLAPAAVLSTQDPTANDHRRSYIDVHQDEIRQMRQAEGLALANALRSGPVSPPSSPEIDFKGPVSPLKTSPVKMTPPPPLPLPRQPRTIVTQNVPYPSGGSPVMPSQPSAASTPEGAARSAYQTRQVAAAHNSPPVSSPTTSVHRAFHAMRQNATSQLSHTSYDADGVSPISSSSYGSPAPSPRPPMAETPPRPPPVVDMPDTTQSLADDVLGTFVARSRHLFELFRLQAETVRPLSTCNAKEVARAGLWWFLVGRLGLESSFRERSSKAVQSDPAAARSNDFAMQQAYADLAKAYWLAGEILPDYHPAPDTENARSLLLYQLSKLSVSMARNNILPPEDAFLPQTIDKTIWLTYPQISSDMVALLWGHWGSSLASAASTAAAAAAAMPMTDALPLADNDDDFVFSRMKADVYLMEQGREESQQFHLPCLLSVSRPRASAMLEIVVASQDETVQLRVRGKKTSGPMWDDVRWRSDMQSLEVRLPRGFVLAIQLAKADYTMLWSMYDFGSKIHSQLYPRREENPVFRTTLKAFQYFETGPPTGSFPKEALPDCEAALFEKSARENAATGLRHFFRGHRVAIVSGTRTRTLYGISQNYLPETPVQFSFLRGEHGDPALLLRFENSRSKGYMVLTFGHPDERSRFHGLLTSSTVRHDETASVTAPIAYLDVRLSSRATMDAASANSTNSVLGAFKKLALKKVAVVNVDDDPDGAQAPTVLAEHLRMIYDNGDSTMVDRLNAAPGELKIRLDVRCSTALTILRAPQEDLTVAVPDMQVARELGAEMAQALRVAKAAPTCRMLRFNTLADVHAVQQAITGFRVLYDGIATTMLIARRLVMSIHKKWETGVARIQIVEHPGSKVVQLLAFFQDFAYGQSMSFVLKGTDVYEAFGRGNKSGIKLDDAKFPLPRLPTNAGSSSSADRSNLGPGSGMLKGINGSSASVGTADAAANVAAGGGSGSEMVSEAGFVCLDMPDLPGEHDDISILFDKESERDKLAAVLPAQVRESRLGKMF